MQPDAMKTRDAARVSRYRKRIETVALCVSRSRFLLGTRPLSTRLPALSARMERKMGRAIAAHDPGIGTSESLSAGEAAAGPVLLVHVVVLMAR